MERVKVLPEGGLSYVAYVSMEEALDALDWCCDQEGSGLVFFSWKFETVVIHPSSELIRGEFLFSDRDDHVLFVLKWVR